MSKHMSWNKWFEQFVSSSEKELGYNIRDSLLCELQSNSGLLQAQASMQLNEIVGFYEEGWTVKEAVTGPEEPRNMKRRPTVHMKEDLDLLRRSS